MNCIKKWLQVVMTLVLVFVLVTPVAQASKSLNPTVSEALETASTYLVESNMTPTFGSEWKIFTLARSNYAVPKGYYETYYNNVVKYLKENNGYLGNRVSEYSRLIIALTAIGYDPQNVGGYNLFEKLADYNKVTSQGINSAIFALLALDTQRFDIPQVNVANLTTREKLVTFILQQEIAQGGFALTGTVPDADITAMTVQALAPYKGRTDVKAVIDRAVNALDNMQLANGGYDSGGENVQSAAQVLVALSTLGIDAATDGRFHTEGGSWILSNMMSYYTAEGGFAHPKGGTINVMATQQVAYALAAYERLLNNQAPLYDTTDTLMTTQKQFAVNVAVQGIHNTIINNMSVTVTEGQTALEALKNLLDAKNIAYQITESSFGPYVASINGEQGGSLGGWDGWSYTVNGEMPNVGMSSYVLKANDVLNVYYSRWAKLTPTTVQANTVNPEVTVNLVGDTFTDAAANVANWTITTGDTTLTVASIEKLSDQSVKVKFNGTAKEGTLSFTANANTLVSNVSSEVVVKVAESKVKLSVQGKDAVILEQLETTIDENQTALEVLKQQLDAKNVAYQIIESSFGPYVASINGEQGGSLGGWDGWSYTVNGEMPNVGMSSYVLKANDVLNVYYSRWAKLTPTTVQANTVNPEVTVNLVGDTFKDAAANIANWTIVTGDTTLMVASIEKLSNQSVKVKFNGTAEEGTLSFTANENTLVGNVESKTDLIIVNDRIVAAKNQFQALKKLKQGIQTSVTLNHEFTVKFNQSINAQDITEGQIVIWDAEANKAIPTQITQGNANAVKVKASSSLQANHYYYLVVNEGTVNSVGQPLKQGVVHLFKTQ